MTISRIATATQNSNTLYNLQQANSAMALSTYQITTGLKSRTLSDDAGNANTLLTLKDVLSRTGSYLTNLNSANNTLTTTENALQQMTDLLTSATSLATTAANESSAATRSTLAPQAQALAESFYNLLNTQYNGQYVFSGSNANQSPISTTAAAAPYGGEPIDTSWYNGDSQLPSVVSGALTTQSYGVTGNDDAFAQLKSGLEALWYGLKNNDVTEINNATAVLSNAKTSLSSATSTIGGQMDNVQQQIDRLTSQQTVVQNNLDDVQNVDVSEALTTFSQQQATLQASMLVISKLNSVSLLDYLR